MKLTRKQVETLIIQTMEKSITPQDAAENILSNLKAIGVVNMSKRTETVIRRDMECMPYEDEMTIEEFGID